MRTIKFRGKTELTGEWVYGFFSMGGSVRFEHQNQDERIVPRYLIDDGLLHDVIPETIGQFTGLTDKNGKEIYEGDIIKIVEKFDDENVYTSNGVVCFEEGIYELQNGKHFAYLGWLMHNDDITKLEVIGNIHDNPELIKKGGQQ